MSCNAPYGDDIRVVVIGAGYAGLIATNRFLGSLTGEERSRISVTVVNPRPDFVERIRLHELAAGSRPAVTTPLREVLHRSVNVVVGSARVIDPDARTVAVHTAGVDIELPFDYLIYAVGSQAAQSIPGSEHAYRVGDYESAQAARGAIARSGPDARIAVVGGGFTGVETASELAEQHPDAEVTLYCGRQLLPTMRPAARRSIAARLRRLGVRIEQGATILRIEAGHLRLAGGPAQPFDVCLLAASFEVPDLADRSGLDVDRTGRLRVDEQLRSLSHSAVFGAGDAIVAPASVAGHLRMGCAVALPLGGQAAESLLAVIRGTTFPTLSIGFLIQCISLGRTAGYIQVVRADDRPRPLHIGGRLGAVVKERICRLVVEAPTAEREEPGTYSWPKGPPPPAPEDLSWLDVMDHQHAGGRA